MKYKLMVTTALTGILLGATSSHAQAPFGGPEDLAYAADLWDEMGRAGFVGEASMMSTPYTGQHPHGAILDTIEGTLSVGNNTGALIVKRNYGGEGVSKEAVANDPGAYLQAITVMYKRAGYDADNQDWFWAKYLPDGSLDKNPKGMELAGRVAKGTPKGCIACHSGAPGGDRVFNHDRYK
jgi:hypothetical protein